MKTLVHCHTEYSTGDGILTTDKLCRVAKEKGFEAVTLTDHGVMGGSYAFITSCKKYDIKPILGVELYYQNELEKSRENKDRSNNHIVAIAKNVNGYRNLVKLSSLGWVNGFYYRPRVDMAMIKEHSKDVKITTACLGGILAPYLKEDNFEGAHRQLEELFEVFGKENVFVEIQFLELEINKEYVERIMKLKERYPDDVQLIFGQDAHFAYKDDRKSFDVFYCIKSKWIWKERKKLGSDYGFIRQNDEVMADWEELGYENLVPMEYVTEAMDNSSKIADDIEVYDIAQDPVLPSVNDMGQPKVSLKELIARGVIDRGIIHMSDEDKQKYMAQIRHEMKLIQEFEFDDYFIMQKLIIDVAKEIGVLVGPGRGSSAGSLVNYLIGNTNVDPIKYGLLFERFINPARKELPDIDTDYSDIDAVKEKLVDMFGAERVVKIATYATFQYKGLLHDLSRVFGYPLKEVMDVSKKLDHIKNLDQMTVEEVIDVCPEFGAWMRRHSADDIEMHVRNLFGVIRHKSQHAAGILIASKPLWNYFPIERVTGELVSAFTEGSRSKELMHIGGVKFDVLGLNTLEIQKHAIMNIARKKGVEWQSLLPQFDTSTINDHDEGVLENIFRAGDTLDIFQFESESARRMLKEIQPDNFMELCVITSINRPGPLQAGYEQIYTDVKFGRQEREIVHPIVDKILDETHGVIVYQEQVIEIARQLGDLTAAEAEYFRKLVFKLDRQKSADVLDERMKHIEQLIEKWETNALKKGMSQAQIDDLWERIKGFLDYAFNKSHALSYAMVAYVSAYIKYHYPIEWHTAYVNNMIRDPIKLQQYIKYLNIKGITIIPPRYEATEVYDCQVIDEKTIMLGVNVVKNCSLDIIGHINKHRHEIEDFVDLFILAQAYPTAAENDDLPDADQQPIYKVNKKTLTSLISVGFFDSLPTIVGEEELTRGRLIKFLYYINDSLRPKMKNKFKKGELSWQEIRGEFTEKIYDEYAKAKLGSEPPFHNYSIEMALMKYSTEDHPLLRFKSKLAEIRERLPEEHQVILGEVMLLKQKFTKGKTRYYRGLVEDITTGQAFQTNYWNNLIDKYDPKEGQYGIFVLSHPHPVYGTTDLINFVEVK